MVDIEIDGDKAVFKVEGFDKLWALRSRLEFPLAHIRAVRADSSIAHGWWHGIRLLGTQVPGLLTAGTFYQAGNTVFWDVSNPDRTIVIDLDHEFYGHLVIEVADPTATVARLQQAIDAQRN